jgi:uncharacterized protein YjbI with pentapeptide repeats
MTIEKGISNDDQEKGLISSLGSEIERVNDPEIDNLIDLLSRPAQGLATEEYLDSIARRQEAVSKFLLRGSAETLRKLFERIKQWETKQPIKLDLSMLEISGRVLGGLYLPGANLDKLVFTESDITGSDLTGSILTEAVAPKAIMRGVIAAGSNWSNAVIPGADMSGGRFVGSIFINTIMPDVIVDKDTNFTGAVFIGTYIGRTDLSIAHTTGAIFRGLRR